MKKMRKLIPALAMLVLSAVMMSTASYAWFSQASNVTASGMEVAAVASGGLIINTTNNSAIFTGSSTVSLSAATGSPLTPASYNGTGNAANKWWTAISDTQNVGAADANQITVLSENSTGDYYIDYTVFVASPGETEKNTINAAITWDNWNDRNGETGKALSVAFYVQEVSAGDNHLVDADVGLAMYPKKSDGEDLPIVVAQQYGTNSNENNTFEIWSGDIPEVKEEDGEVLAITMRVYLDGNLSYTSTSGNDTATYYYVRSSSFDPKSFGFDVQFSASQKATT